MSATSSLEQYSLYPLVILHDDDNLKWKEHKDYGSTRHFISLIRK